MVYSHVSGLCDRLSELPTCLILVILSFLPFRDVVTTSLLSKRWKKHLWTTLPCLVSREQNFVCEALELHKGYKIIKLTLNFRYGGIKTSRSGHNRDSQHLFPFAIENQVEEQYINVASRCRSLWRSIRELSFVSYALEIDGNIVQWNKSLTVVQGSQPLSDGVINQFLSDVPDLEIFNLRVHECREELNIRSSNLKFCKMERLLSFPFMNNWCREEAMLTIWAPNLERLQIYGSPYGRCLLNVPSLTKVVLDFHDRPKVVQEAYVREVFASFDHVENLTLSDRCIEVLFEMKKKKDRSDHVPLSNVKFLKFYANATDKMLQVLEMFPQLTTLVIERKVDRMKKFGRYFSHAEYVDKSEETNMLRNMRFKRSFLQQLRTVKIAWYLDPRDTSMQVVIETLLKNAPMLEKMVFHCPIPYKGIPHLQGLSLVKYKVLRI